MRTEQACCYIIACEGCGVSELGSAEHSASGGEQASFPARTKFEIFDVKQSEIQGCVPTIDQATCKVCGATATVEHHYPM